MIQKPRVFLDANILIRGVTFPRFPYEVLRHAARKEIVAIVCPLVLDGVRLVVKERFPDTQNALEALLELLDLEVDPRFCKPCSIRREEAGVSVAAILRTDVIIDPDCIIFSASKGTRQLLCRNQGPGTLAQGS